MQVHVAKADITNLPVDAVVLAINSEGTILGDEATPVRDHGGPAIEKAARDAAPIAIGAAIITEPGDLPAKHVIHVPIVERPPGASTTEAQNSSAEEVRRAARAALLGAAARKLPVIAMPAIGTGNAVAEEDVARCIVEEIQAHKREFPQEIYLVSLRDKMVEEFEYALGGDPS